MIYGYCRVSTPRQNIERQVRNIRAAYPDAVLLQEAYSGTTSDRPKWQRLCSRAKAGDVIVFDAVARMSRNAEEGFADYEKLFYRGVELVFLKEPHISTEVFRRALEASVPLTGGNVDFILDGVNKYLMALAREQIQLAFDQAQKEVDDLHQRTKEGIETARINGAQIGRRKGSQAETQKAKDAKALIRKYSKAFDGNLEDAAVMKLTGISHNSYYKYKRELRSIEKEKNA